MIRRRGFSWAAELTGCLAEGWRLRSAVGRLTGRSLAAHTRGSVLGVGWLVIEPAFLFLLYLLVFGQILQVRFRMEGGTDAFALYLWCGLIPYNTLQQAVLAAATVLPGNRSLLLHSRFPAWVLPLVEVFSTTAAEAVALGLLMGVLLWMGQGSPWWGMLPLLMAVRWLLTLGLAWLASVLTVFVRDFGQLLRLGLTLGFFVTPIIYPLGMIPAGWRFLEAFNPFHWLVAAYRAALLEGAAPPAGFWWLAAAALGFAALALLFFNRAVERAKDFL